MKIESNVQKFIRRFWTDTYQEYETEWMKKFCDNKNINAKFKMSKLKNIF